MPKLVVGYPWSSPFTFTAFTDHLPNLKHPEGWEVEFVRGAGWSPARRHIHICEQAIERGADLICIIGTDQVHPLDMLQKLIARWNEGYEVVTAMVPTRGYISWNSMKPFQPMAWRFKENPPNDVTYRAYRGQELDPDLLQIIDPKDGEIQKVNFIGSGVLMFHKEHLLALKKPWFAEQVRLEDYQRVSNMDCRFVWRLQMEAFATVWCDTTIKVKHLHVFPIDETYQDRFSDWMEGNGDPAICRYREAGK